MLITWLTLAFRYSGNETFLSVLDWVVEEHGYAFNAVNGTRTTASCLVSGLDTVHALK